MSVQSSGVMLPIVELSARLLQTQELGPRARITAQVVAEVLPGSAVNVYVTSGSPDGEVWTWLASIGDVAVPEPNIPLQTGTLGILSRELKDIQFEGSTLIREEFAHLHVRRTLQSLSYLPLIQEGVLVGAIEILSFDDSLGEGHLDPLRAVAEVASSALFAAQTYRDERDNTLTSITRLTQLYDIEQVFSSTLEMDQLLPIIGSKVREMLECEAVNVWLLEADESLRLVHQAGTDVTVQPRGLQRPGEGIAGDVSDNGEPVLIQQPDDERLMRRNSGIQGGGVRSLIVAPLMDR